MSTPEDIVRTRLANEQAEQQRKEDLAQRAAEQEVALLHRRAQVALAMMEHFQYFGATLIQVEGPARRAIRRKTARIDKVAWQIGTAKFRSYGDEIEQPVWLGADGLVYSGQASIVGSGTPLEVAGVESVRQACSTLEHLVNLLTLRRANLAVDEQISERYSVANKVATQRLNEVMRPLYDESERWATAENKGRPLVIETSHAEWLKIRLDAGYIWLDEGIAPT